MRVQVPGNFTLDVLLAELADAPVQHQGYRTMAEWAEHFGISLQRMNKLLLAARSRGKLLVQHEARTAIDGRLVQVPVYGFEIGDGTEHDDDHQTDGG